MSGASSTTLAARRRALADCLRAQRAIRSDAVYAAFCAVSRHVFVPVAYRGNGTTPVAFRLSERDEAALDLVYRDRTLVTEVDAAGRPASSSTAPSVMGFMLEALALRPGLRVLEIGCGTGYNAALIHAVTGAEVVSVDPQGSLVSQARRAMRRHGTGGVTCLAGDGYDGAPGAAPFDRVIATCSVAGIPPPWLDQCAGQWRMVVPLVHGGVDMLALVEPDGETVTVRPIGGAGYFIKAQGPLYPQPPPEPVELGHPTLELAAPVPGFRLGYHDMWFMAAVDDARVTAVYGDGVDGSLGRCGLADPGGTALFHVDGFVRAAGRNGRALAGAATALLRRWWVAGRPRAREWSAGVRMQRRGGGTLYVACGWRRR